jgi:hypothetical protein
MVLLVSDSERAGANRLLLLHLAAGCQHHGQWCRAAPAAIFMKMIYRYCTLQDYCAFSVLLMRFLPSVIDVFLPS